MHQHAIDREAREVGRLQQVMDLAQNKGCQVSALCAHFDGPLDAPCGHCTWCLNHGASIILAPRSTRQVDDEIWSEVIALRQDHADVLSEPYAVARLLCGDYLPEVVAGQTQLYLMVWYPRGYPVSRGVSAGGVPTKLCILRRFEDVIPAGRNIHVISRDRVPT